MMRPLILSSPEKTAVGFAIRCGGGATITSSVGGCVGAPAGGVAACEGAPAGGWIGVIAVGCPGAPCAGCCGAAGAPGGGGSSSLWIPPAPGRLDGGRLIGAGSG